MSVIHQVKYACARVVERHPYSQNLTRRLLFHVPFLLPHDRSYLGMRHLLDHRNRLFLDVGANDGMSALSFRRIDRRYVFDVVSIEPNRLHAPSLDGIARRDPRFRYVLTAAGDEKAELSLFTPVYGRTPLHTQSSLCLDHARAMVEEYMPAFVARRVHYTHQIVQLLPLDELDLAPGIVKVDAEGFDDKVLRGLRGTLETHRPYLLVERNASTAARLDAFCRELDYTILQYDDVEDRFDRTIDGGSRNVYYVPDEGLDRLLSSTQMRDRGNAAGARVEAPGPAPA